MAAEGNSTISTAPSEIKATTRDLSVWYKKRKGEEHAVRHVSTEIRNKAITALIGASGSGKTSFLRCFNRMIETVEGARTEGAITIEGKNIFDRDVDPIVVRTKIGMVFQKPNPFPMSIYDNIAYGPRIHGMVRSKTDTDMLVEQSLRRAGLWNEAKDRLLEPGTHLSGGQQQRLVIARTVAINPDMILMDEPCASLDRRATERVERTVRQLSNEIPVIIVTHDLHQASRLSDETMYFEEGRLIEKLPTLEMFTNPRDGRTQEFITGRLPEGEDEGE